ncbi:MAG: low molecular weight phosphatase family protein [Jatrophihabitantaceae bacterium]
MSFSVLFVCTGNICRSPIAERLFRARVPAEAPMIISSAGTMALIGYPMDAACEQALRELGGDGAEHVGRMLSSAMVADADLILSAETAHRSAIVQDQPAVFRRAFTIREFGRLGATLAPPTPAAQHFAWPPPPPPPPTTTSLRQRVAAVADQRGRADAPEPGADEIGDPFGAPLQVARDCAAEIAQALDAVIATLGVGLPAER